MKQREMFWQESPVPTTSITERAVIPRVLHGPSRPLPSPLGPLTSLSAPHVPSRPLTVPQAPSRSLSAPRSLSRPLASPHVPSRSLMSPHGPASAQARGAPPPPGGAIVRAGGLKVVAAIGPCGWGGATRSPAQQSGKGWGSLCCSGQPLDGPGPGRGRGSARRLEAVPGRRERRRDMAVVLVTTEGPVEVSPAAPLGSAWPADQPAAGGGGSSRLPVALRLLWLWHGGRPGETAREVAVPAIVPVWCPFGWRYRWRCQ